MTATLRSALLYWRGNPGAQTATSPGYLIRSRSPYNLLFLRLGHALGSNSMLWRPTSSLLGNVSEMLDASGSVLELLIT